jgi:hypothetical protein
MTWRSKVSIGVVAAKLDVGVVREEEVVGSNPATPTRVVADHRP